MYKENDYVIYRHNVCKIKSITENKQTGKAFYTMNPIEDVSLIINIPVNSNLLRKIISSDEAKILIEKIPQISPLTDINEKNIETQYKELLNIDNHENLVKIIKTTYLRNEKRINNKKKISDKDDKYFNLAEKYLYNELSISLNMTVESIKEYIFEIVNK